MDSFDAVTFGCPSMAAQQFGLGSSVKVNIMSVVHTITTAANLTRSVAMAAK